MDTMTAWYRQQRLGGRLLRLQTHAGRLPFDTRGWRTFLRSNTERLGSGHSVPAGLDCIEARSTEPRNALIPGNRAAAAGSVVIASCVQTPVRASQTCESAARTVVCKDF